MPVSNRTRFEVFKRDGFACQYCGRHPPETVLEADHMEPASLGGSDEINNLVTACYECNRGKGAVRLSENAIGKELPDNLELLREKKRQAEAYAEYLTEIRAEQDRWVWEITKAYEHAYRGWTLAPRYKNATLRPFLRQLPGIRVYELMELAVSKFSDDSDRALRYFAGCCWKRIKGERND